MSQNTKLRPYLKRLAIIFLICFGFVFLFNEITFRLLKDSADRAPESIQVVIPAGTAARLAAGEQVSTIPDGLSFVAGDVLEVINLDNTDHQLGPMWIPAGVTASLALDTPEKLSYSCSFSPSKYLELDVRQPTTVTDRIFALTLGAPTLAILAFLYSLAARPIVTDEKRDEDNRPAAVAKG